jgi:hypothetical protein
LRLRRLLVATSVLQVLLLIASGMPFRFSLRLYTHFPLHILLLLLIITSSILARILPILIPALVPLVASSLTSSLTARLLSRKTHAPERGRVAVQAAPSGTRLGGS